VGGFTFQVEHDFINALTTFQRHQAMNMIQVPVDEIDVNPFAGSGVSDVRKKNPPDFGSKERFSVFRGPDQVNPDFYVSHTRFFGGLKPPVAGADSPG
jgi:hypothetical protein